MRIAVEDLSRRVDVAVALLNLQEVATCKALKDGVIYLVEHLCPVKLTVFASDFGSAKWREFASLLR